MFHMRSVWSLAVRNPKAPGGAKLVPHLIHNRSGAGSDILVIDPNDDGRIDVVIATHSGSYVSGTNPTLTPIRQKLEAGNRIAFSLQFAGSA